MPSHYGSWWRVYALLHSFRLSGIWAQIEVALQVQADGQVNIRPYESHLFVDSTTSGRISMQPGHGEIPPSVSTANRALVKFLRQLD
ncbi:hypothetical protein CFAEC_05375 [Corynebacterium faecale]|nr:hypothetical protein CFAEC_05375 [Corynebacterium faecale]